MRRSHLDDRLTAIARMIRSDNQALAQAFQERQATAGEPVDPELLRQTVRAIKELQAGLAHDVQATVEHRFQSVSDQLHKETQSTAESMVKVAEILGNKIDRLSVRVDEGYGNDLQVVIDRMGDAIQAMSSVRRGLIGLSRGLRRRAARRPPRLIGYSVYRRAHTTHVSTISGPLTASTTARCPPASIVSPMWTGVRNRAVSLTTLAGSPPAQSTTHFAM